MPNHDKQIIYEKTVGNVIFEKLWKTLKIGIVLGTIAGLLALGYTVEYEAPENQSLLAQVMKPVAEKLLAGVLKVVTNTYFYGTLISVLTFCTVFQLVFIWLLRTRSARKVEKRRTETIHGQTFGNKLLGIFSFLKCRKREDYESFSESLDLGSLQQGEETS